MKFTLSILLITVMLLLSCKDKEEEPAAVVFEDEKFEFSSALMEEWGAHTGNHYNMDFSLVGTEALFVPHTSVIGSTYYTFSENPSFYLFFELFATGKEAFHEGTFHALNGRDWEDIQEENVFRTFQWGRSLTEKIKVTEGVVTVRIFKNGLYRMQFHVTTEEGQNLTGEYYGIPNYLDRR